MSDDADTLERPKAADHEKGSEVKENPEETFEMNGAYIAEQAREAMRVFFLPMSSIVRAARAKSRSVRRDARRASRRA